MKKISEVARELRVSTATLRRYEARGVFPVANRTPFGWRYYTDEDIALLKKLLAKGTGLGATYINS